MHKIIQQKEWRTTSWSGGTTSEIYIFPENSLFKKGNYQLRISVAKVEVEASSFTSLPNIDRVLTVLDGEIQLIHEDQHSVALKQYEQDSFSGNWSTKSIGKVRDFNVMTNNYKVKVDVVRLQENQSLLSKRDVIFFVAKGKIKVGESSLADNDTIILNSEDTIRASTRTVLICVEKV